MKLIATILVALIGTPMRAHGGTVVVETCDDLETAVAATATEDTTAWFTSAFLSCQVESQGDGEYAVRTYTITDNRLTIEAADVDKITIYDARFDLISSGELYVTPDIVFDMTFRIDEAVVSVCARTLLQWIVATLGGLETRCRSVVALCLLEKRRQPVALNTDLPISAKSCNWPYSYGASRSAHVSPYRGQELKG